MKTDQTDVLYLRDQEVADAIRTVLRSMPRLYLGGASFTPDQLATLIERRIVAAKEIPPTLPASQLPCGGRS
jgi:hypothetical protein